jgi:hypothetical protein
VVVPVNNDSEVNIKEKLLTLMLIIDMNKGQTEKREIKMTIKVVLIIVIYIHGLISIPN